MPAQIRGISLLLAAVIACGPEQRSAADSADSADGATAGGGMKGMDHGVTSSRGMMMEMRAYLLAMTGASPDSLRRMMPAHRQMAANLLQQMEAEMRAMSMTGDTTWRAATDSIRQDLTGMPELTRAELPAFMRGHGKRMVRVMSLHDSMMGIMD